MRDFERPTRALAPKQPAAAPRTPATPGQRQSRPGRADPARIAGQLAALRRPPPDAPAVQLRPIGGDPARRRNETGLPDGLKRGIEALSGFSLDDVRVHFGSSKPAQLQAAAYTHGTQIHVASGQERHLPHEAWHVVQQKQGRVRPTAQMKGMAINDDPALEQEADRFGDLASAPIAPGVAALQRKAVATAVVQRVTVTASGYTVSLTNEFTKNHIRSSKAAALSRSRKRELPTSTIVNSHNANVKTTVEASQLNLWVKPAGEERHFQSFNLPHWVTTKVGQAYNITDEQNGVLRLGGYFKPAVAKAEISHLG